jgi:probable F420-dependent oxidoreductase
VRFALGFPLAGHPVDPALLDGEVVARLAQAAAEAGFDAVYFTEHPIPPDRWLQAGGHDALDPFVALAFAAAAAPSLRLLTNLTVLPYRNPFLVAKAVATLDRLSEGRVTLGVGTGYLKAEYHALGVDFDERNALFDESLEVCRKVWAGATVDHEGRHFSARGVTALPTPVQEPLPVWIGGNSALTRRRVAERAQGWMPLPNPAAYAAARRTPVLESLDDLEAMLGHLRGHAGEVGRTEPVDVLFMSFEGGVPGEPGWEPRRHVDDVRAQADLGVTWQAVNALGATPADVLAMVARYGDEVIATLR